MNYSVDVIRSCTAKARLTLSTPTHGNGDRLDGLRRNMDNLDGQSYQDWKQVIVIDHSPQEVVWQVIGMVEASRFPERREVLWMHGDKPTGSWGRFSHNEVLRRCDTEYLAFHCDDNFVSMSNYADLVKLLDSDRNLAFAYSCCCAFRGGTKTVMPEFRVGALDLGCSVIRTVAMKKHLPSLALLPDIYAWDWKMVSWLAFNDLLFTTTDRVGYFWAKDYSGPAEPVITEHGDQPIGGVRNIWDSIKTKYPGFVKPAPQPQRAGRAPSPGPGRSVWTNPAGVCGYYRGGWAVEQMISEGLLKRAEKPQEADIALVVRCTPKWEPRPGQQVIYSNDDLFWDVPEGHPDRAAMTAQIPNCDHWLQSAGRVVSSTGWLAEYMNHKGARADAVTIENALPADWFERKEIPRRWDGRVVMSVGLRGHEYDMTKTGLFSEMGKIPFLSVLGFTDLPMPSGVSIKGYHDFREANRPLAQFRGAIGLVPLIEHPFNRAKSILKLIEYVAKGIMPLCSPVGEYARLGEKFPWILKDPAMTWLQAISAHSGNMRKMPELYDYVRANYTFNAKYPEWKRVLMEEKP